MTNNTPPLPRETMALADAIGRLPIEHQTELAPLLKAVLDSDAHRHRALNLVRDTLGQLRLDFKYLIFDLEATRRERDEYRRKAD